MALGGTIVAGGQSKVLTVNAMIARETPGGTSVPGGQTVSGGASVSGDTSIIEGTPILRTQVNRGCATVTASMAAPEDTTILRSVSLTRHLLSQNSMVAPGIVLAPDLGPPLNMDVELKSERAAPMGIGGKKIKRDNDPSKGATYAMLDETMSSISDQSSVSNSGVRRKRATAEDDDFVVIGRHHTGRNQINPHGRRGGEEDEGEGTGSVVRDVRGSRDIWGVRRIRTERGWDDDLGEDNEKPDEDFAEDLFRFIKTLSKPWTSRKVYLTAAPKFRGTNECVLQSHVNTMLVTMRKTAQCILRDSAEGGTPIAGSQAATIHINMDTVNEFTGAV